MVQAMLCGKEGLFFLSPAPVGRFPSTLLGIVREYTASDPEAGLRENYFFGLIRWGDESDQPSVPYGTCGLIYIQ